MSRAIIPAILPGALLLVLTGGALLVAAIAVVSAFPSSGGAAAGTVWVGQWLWDSRGLDLAAQALLVLAGVFGVLFVLGREGS